MAPNTATTAAATWDSTLDGLHFVNPDAAQARSRRRVKLAAARSRLAALAASGGGVFPPGEGACPAGNEKEVRKQQRMLRNRESAALSRKRKSDRIGELELQVEALQEENRRLRQRVDSGGSIGVASASPTTASPAPAAPAHTPPAAAATCAAPPRTTWAPTNLAAHAALSATSIVVPSASTTNIVPATPPASAADGDIFRLHPGASATPSGSSASFSCSTSSAANACFNFISRPAAETTAAKQKQQKIQQQEQEQEQQTEASTDGEAGSSSSCSSSDSEDAEADDSIDFLFAELMAEEDVPAAAAAAAAAAGGGEGAGASAEHDLLLFWSGVSGVQAPALSVIETGSVRAI